MNIKEEFLKIYNSMAEGDIISTDILEFMDNLETYLENTYTHKKSKFEKNKGTSNYSSLPLQPWDVWLNIPLNPWDADTQKRILRTKVEANMTPEESRILDYEKIITNANERIRQLKENDGIYGKMPNQESIDEQLLWKARLIDYQKALQEISALPSVRQDEACNLALGAIDKYKHK